MVGLLAAPWRMGSWPGTSALHKRQNQMFGCNCRKVDVGQLRTSGKLKAKTEAFLFSTMILSHEEQLSELFCSLWYD